MRLLIKNTRNCNAQRKWLVYQGPALAETSGGERGKLPSQGAPAFIAFHRGQATSAPAPAGSGGSSAVRPHLRP